MELDIIQPLLHYLHHHQHHAGLIAAVITFIESLAVIGTFIPGSVTLGATGTLIGSATIPATSTILYIGIGAFLGDFISYGIGRYYKERIKTVWPFTRYPKLLEKSRHYCQKHGGKSILIGRFTGPMRSFVPLITGMMHMPVTRFVGAALPSAFAWVLTFLAPGILLGALSHEIPAKLAGEFLAVGLAVILITWFLLWCLTHFFEQISSAMKKICDTMWQGIRRHRTGRLLTQPIVNIQQPSSGTPLLRCIIIVGSLILFAAIGLFVNAYTLRFPMDRAMFHLIRSLRSTSLEPTMVALSLLGKHYTIELASLGILAWLCYQRQFRYASCLALALIAGITSIWTCKHLLYAGAARPDGILNPSESSAFPSGHVTMSTTIMVLLAIWIKDLLQRKWQWVPPIIACFFITLIAVSRLYLGAHWLSDVFGGIFLGLAIAHATLLVFWRNAPIVPPKHRHFSVVTILSFLCAWLLYGYFNYQTVLHDYTPQYKTHKLNVGKWWQGQSTIPLVRTNRFGQAEHVLNIQWLGQADTITTLMQQHGWQQHPTDSGFRTTLHRLTAAEALPLLPKLYQNKAPALLFTHHKHNKASADDTSLLITRLWPFNTDKAHTPILWVGTLGTAHKRQHIFSIHHDTTNDHPEEQIDMITNTLDPKVYEWKTMKPPGEDYPDEVVILIRPQQLTRQITTSSNG